MLQQSGYKASLLHRSPSPSSISRNSGFGAWKVNNSAWTLAFSYRHDRGGSREAPSEGFQMGEYPTKGSGHRGRGEDMTGFMRIGDHPNAYLEILRVGITVKGDEILTGRGFQPQKT